MKYFMSATIFCFLMLLAFHTSAFQQDGCGAGDCRGCHALTKPEASEILKDLVSEVLEVKMSEVPGLWEVDVVQKGKKIPLYMDFSKKYLISGLVVKVETRENLTQKKYFSLNTVDVAQIPLDDAVVIGNPMAAKRIIVFDDPECTFCKKLHPEMKKVAAEHKEVAFFIKMFPLKSHPKAYAKAKAIVCEKSAELLEASLAGKDIPPPTCETDVIDKNIAYAKKNYIGSTPTLILPDGRVVPGYKQADVIIQLLNEKK